MERSNGSEYLKIGEKLKKDIFIDGVACNMLAKTGTIITQELIDKLKNFETAGMRICFRERAYTTVEHKEITRKNSRDTQLQLSEKLKSDAIEAAETIFKSDTSMNTIQSIAKDVSAEIADSIIRNNEYASVCIQDLRVADEYTYQHSVDVSLLSAWLAKTLGLNRRDVHDIAEAGMLHDIGKRKIPLEILNKPGKLTSEEFEIIKRHPIYAYKDLMGLSSISDRIKLGVLEHHEKASGLGYPRGITLSNISTFGQIISIVDVYDALTSKRPYKDGMSTASAIGVMAGMRGSFNVEFFKTFVSNLIIYPKGTSVLCTDGMTWIVEEYNAEMPSKPVIKNLITGEVVNLADEKNCNISIFGEDCKEIREKFRRAIEKE